MTSEPEKDFDDLDDEVSFLLSVASEMENMTLAQKVATVRSALQIHDARIIDQARNDVIEMFRKDLTEQTPTLPPSLENPVAEALARFRNPLTTDTDAKLLLVSLMYSLAFELLAQQPNN